MSVTAILHVTRSISRVTMNAQASRALTCAAGIDDTAFGCASLLAKARPVDELVSDIISKWHRTVPLPVHILVSGETSRAVINHISK